MEKAFIYARVSSTSQIDGNGFDRQEKICRDFAKTAGFEIVAVYKEDVSGTKSETERPVFQDLMSAILTNGVHTIIVESLDRLAREFRIQETLLIYLASKNIDLISARTGENVTQAVQADPMKKALIQIQGIFSELEKNQIVRRLRIARQKIKAKTGKCEGRKGYSDTEAGRAIVHKIRLLRRRPKVGQRLTWRQIAERLNSEGLRTIDGEPWTLYRVAQLASKK